MKKNINKKMSIGIFDSGFGGLNIMQGIVRELPEYNFVYLGDTARVPYGNRSNEVIYEFTIQAVNFLFKKNCQLIIFACNTVSSYALRKIQREYLPKFYPDRRVLGVVIPTVEAVALETKNKRVGVVATNGTVVSNVFLREFSKIDPNIKIFQKACPLLVPIIEAGESNSEITRLVLEKYLIPLIKKKIDVLILGCTHYGILKRRIKEIVGEKIAVISEADIVAVKLKDYLSRHPEIEKKLGKNSKRSFYSTDLTRNFCILGSKFFGQKIQAQKAKLE